MTSQDLGSLAPQTMFLLQAVKGYPLKAFKGISIQSHWSLVKISECPSEEASCGTLHTVACADHGGGTGGVGEPLRI